MIPQALLPGIPTSAFAVQPEIIAECLTCIGLPQESVKRAVGLGKMDVTVVQWL
jgi:hypothetical protein